MLESLTRQHLIDALCREYEFLCHDDFDPDVDPPLDEYREMLNKMTIGDLVLETGTDQHYTLDEYLSTYS